jgi:hypothetical protein
MLITPPPFHYVNGASAVFTAAGYTTTSSSNYYFADSPFGAEDDTRRIYLFLHTGDSDGGAVNYTISSIGGVSASKVLDHDSSYCRYQVWTAKVPNGTTGEIHIIRSASQWTQLGVHLYAVYNASSGTPYDTYGSTSTAQNQTGYIDIPDNGVVIGMKSEYESGFGGAATCTWTGLTEDADYQNSGFAQSSASGRFSIAQTNFPIQANLSSSGSDFAGFSLISLG